MVICALIFWGRPGNWLPSLSETVTFTDTAYGRGYSYEKFQKIEAGMTGEKVVAILGEPVRKYRLETDGFGDYWTYEEFGVTLTVKNTKDRNQKEQGLSVVDHVGKLPKGMRPRIAADELLSSFGEPTHKQLGRNTELWFYSKSPTGTHYWQAIVYIDTSPPYLVSHTKFSFYGD